MRTLRPGWLRARACILACLYWLIASLFVVCVLINVCVPAKQCVFAAEKWPLLPVPWCNNTCLMTPPIPLLVYRCENILRHIICLGLRPCGGWIGEMHLPPVAASYAASPAPHSVH